MMLGSPSMPGTGISWLSSLLRWGHRAFFAVADQGLVSGTNFLLNVLLARWLRPEEYGAYGLVFSFYMFLSSVHQNYFLEPLSVLGVSTFRTVQEHYFGVLLWMQVVFTAVMLVAGLTAAVALERIWHMPEIAGTVRGMAFGGPFILLLYFARSACYIKMLPSAATQGAFLYSVLVFSICWLIQTYGTLSPGTVFLSMGAGGAGAALFLLIKLRPKFGMDTSLASRAAREHWIFGRWGLASLPVYWATDNMAMLMSGMFLGIREAAAVRAVSNLILPLGQLTAAVNRLAQPHISRQFSEHGARAVASSTQKLVGILALAAGGSALISTIFRSEIMHILYKDKYSEFAYLIPILSLSFSFYVVYQAYSIGLRALHNPKPLFFAYSVAAAVSVAGGYIGIQQAGLPGMMSAPGVANLTALTITAFSFYRTVRATAVEARAVPKQHPLG